MTALGRAGAVLAAAAWLALAGCAAFTPEPGERMATRGTGAAALAAGVWTAQPGVRVFRQTALFESRGTKVAADGLLRFDPAARTARLVAVNEVGLKLFDVTVTPDDVSENFLLPDLAKAPGFSAAVATCLRAVFVGFPPRATDTEVFGPDTYVLSRPEGGGRLACVFGGAETLLFKEYEGDGQSWTVRFYDYRPEGGLLAPGRTVFTDRRAGYRVSLWLQEVRAAGE